MRRDSLASMDNLDCRRQLFRLLESLGPGRRKAETLRIARLLMPGRTHLANLEGGELSAKDMMAILVMVCSNSGASLEMVSVAIEASAKGAG